MSYQTPGLTLYTPAGLLTGPFEKLDFRHKPTKDYKSRNWKPCYRVTGDCKFRLGIATYTVHPGDIIIPGGWEQGVCKKEEFERLFETFNKGEQSTAKSNNT